MGSHSVTCRPAEVTFPPLLQPIKAGTRFSDPRGMQGWVDLVGLVTYQGGIPARRRSSIPVLTGLNVEQLRSCDERCYHSAKPVPIHSRFQSNTNMPKMGMEMATSLRQPFTERVLDIPPSTDIPLLVSPPDDGTHFQKIFTHYFPV